MSFENKVGRISDRNWGQIADLWLRAIPMIDPPGSPPAHAISAIPGLSEIVRNVEPNAEFRDDLPQLRSAILHEGVYLLHKAAHVVGASELHAAKGLLSWSLSSAYQGAFFSLKAILAFLGIACVEVSDKTYLIDVWPGPVKGQRKQARRYEVGSEMQFILFPRLEHRHMWQIFQRVLRVSEIECWDEGCMRALRDLDHLAFARQRNTLHYQNHRWLWGDLLDPTISDSFGIFDPNIPVHARMDVDRQDFSAILAFVLLKFALDLFKGITNNAVAMEDELELITSSLNEDRHPLLISGFL